MVDYIITRSKRKTLAIHVTKDAAVEVKAPLKMPASDIERFVLQKQAWIENTVHKISERRETAVTISKEQEIGLRQMAEKVIPERVAFYADIIGVTPTAVKIGGARSMWGSCSGKNSLNFSWRLMLAEIDVIDYVIVHECIHCKHHNHSKQFWKAVEDVMPDYKERRKKLKNMQLIL